MTTMFRHSMPTVAEFSEGRLFARLVPYDTPVMVADELPNGGVDVYEEGFRSGAFTRQAATAEPGVLRRIGLKHEHLGGLGYLGPCVELDDRADGLYGWFRVLPSMRDDVAELAELGIDQVSIEFRLRGAAAVSDKAGDDGVRWRTDVHLDAAAILPQGAYGRVGAGVLAMRDLDELAEEKAAQDAARVERERAEAEEAAEAERQRKADEQRAADEERRRERLAAIQRTQDEQRRHGAELAQRFG